MPSNPEMYIGCKPDYVIGIAEAAEALDSVARVVYGVSEGGYYSNILMILTETEFEAILQQELNYLANPHGYESVSDLNSFVFYYGSSYIQTLFINTQLAAGGSGTVYSGGTGIHIYTNGGF